MLRGLDVSLRSNPILLNRIPDLHLWVWDFIVAGVGFEPTASRLCYRYNFHCSATWRICGLDYPITPQRALGCLPSSLYTFPDIIGTWLGIGTSKQAFPEFDRFATAVASRRAHTLSLASYQAALPRACIVAVEG